ncbi:hypothetical protein LTR95_001859 [Oleoguttula sp. CCFEE 5521]
MADTEETEVLTTALEIQTSSLRRYASSLSLKMSPSINNFSRFIDGKYYDLTIEVGDRKWKVHKIVVCAGATSSRRPVMAAFRRVAKERATRGVLSADTAREATFNIIQLPDDDPKAVNALLEYLYGRDFTSLRGKGDEGFDEDAALLVAVFNLADKYVVQSLKDLAKTRFRAPVEDATADGGLPVLIDTVEDAVFDGPGDLQAMLINHLGTSYPKLFDHPDNFKEIHEALARNPMMAYKIAIVSARQRVAGVVHYTCAKSDCPMNAEGFELSKSQSQRCIRCLWWICNATTSPLEPDAEE